VNGLQRADERGGNPPSVATDGVRSRYQNAVYEPQSGITRWVQVGQWRSANDRAGRPECGWYHGYCLSVFVPDRQCVCAGFFVFLVAVPGKGGYGI